MNRSSATAFTWWALMVVVVVSSWSVVLVQGETCFDNITLIVAYEKLYSTADVLSLRRTYYLCPNMVFPMGVYNSSLGIWVDGNEPIVPRVNMTILCGLDGSSVNNCLLEGGWYGLVHANLFPERVEGVLIQGLTFQSQTLAAIDLQYDGNITFVDCIIEQHSTNSPVVMPLGNRRRRHLPWSITSDFDPVDRTTLHSDAVAALQVSFQDCVFRDNHRVALSNSQDLGPGLITAVGTQTQTVVISIQTSLFVNNSFGSNTTSGWAIQTNGPLSLQSNCWIDNSFWGPAPIQVLSNASFYETDNYETHQNGNVSCSFALLAFDNVASASQCVRSHSSACVLLPPLVAAITESRPIITFAPSRSPHHPTTSAAMPTLPGQRLIAVTSGVSIFWVASMFALL